MHNLTLYVEVYKTGSASMRALLANTAHRSGVLNWLCPASRNNYTAQHAPVLRAEVEVCAGEHWGSGDVLRPPVEQLLTTLREPMARLVSEYAYFCQYCHESMRFCGKDRRSNTDCSNGAVNFSTWIERAPNVYTRQFSAYWPVMSYSDAWMGGFPNAEPLTADHVSRAERTLTRPSSFVVWTDEMADAPSDTLERMSAWLGRRAGMALMNRHEFPHDNWRPFLPAYVPTATERAHACRMNWADCALYQRLRNRSCAC